MKNVKKLDRRGVSPVIATILLILIAIAAGVIIYTYTIGFLGTAGPASGQGELAIDAGFVQADGAAVDDVTVYLRNVGGVTINITDVFVTELSSGEIYALRGSDGDYTCTASCVLAPGDTNSVELVAGALSAGDILQGRDYTIKAVADDGTTVSGTFRAGA